MAERPEVAIQAILVGIQNMQQLNMQLADHFVEKYILFSTRE